MNEKEKEKLKKFDPRGVQTLFRTLSRNHYNLLKMVDNKASIILTINSIIISLLMGAMYVAPDTELEIIRSGVKVLMKFCWISMILAMIGMLPHRYRGKSFKNSHYNGILYAQSFSRLSLEDYKKEMNRVIDSGENLYKELIEDLYFLGRSIAIKQRFVIFSFVVFMAGVIFMIVFTESNGL